MAKNDDKKQLRAGVIGMGPVGAGLAAHLIKAGSFVVPCDIDRKKIDRIKADGICLEQKIEMKAAVTDACYSAEELDKHNLDIIAVAVKTPSLKKIVSLLEKISSQRFFVMCAQNGLDNEQEVARVLGEDRTLRMAVNYAGGMSDDSTVNITFFNPPNYISALSPAGEAMAGQITELLNTVGLTTEISANYRDHAWEKAILNSSLSPVCAITGLTMKHVMDSADGFAMVQAIIDESIRIAEAEGINLKTDFRQHSINYLKNAGYHRPSMLVDLENGLPTEIDYLNGRISDYGRKHGLPTPINRSITAFVHMLELANEIKQGKNQNNPENQA